MQRHNLFRKVCFLGLFFFSLMMISAKKVAHPFFISVTEIRSDSKKQTFQVSCRMFTDDLQEALYKLYQYKTELSAQETGADAYLNRYISERLQINVGGKYVPLTFVGYEIEEEATWCYLETTTFPGTGQAQVNNRLLYDFISGQTNLVHFYKDGVRSSSKLNNPDYYIAF
jgi:hypothetical protein